MTLKTYGSRLKSCDVSPKARRRYSFRRRVTIGTDSDAGLAGAVHVRFKGDAITAIDTAASRKD